MKNQEQKHTGKKIGKRAAVFYGILVLCLLGVGATAYYSTNIRLNPAPETTEQANTTEQAITARFDTDALTKSVNDVVTGVPDDRVTESPTASSEVAVQASEDNIQRAPSFSLPLGGETDKGFSNGDMVQSKTMGDWRVHNGVDFRGTVGDPVIAVNNGVVKAVYDDVLWGTVVEVDHGQGMLARYCGLGRGSTVAVGDSVKINDKIGNLGAIPIEAADEVHLHFEILQDGKAVDPMSVLKS